MHARGALALRMAEGGEREQRHPRLIAEPARDAGRLDGDVGDLLGLRHFGDRGVGDQHGAPAASTIDTPITRWPGFGSITRRTSSSATEKLRVTPVTMASASPSATMQAAKWLRSLLTSRWQSRCR